MATVSLIAFGAPAAQAGVLGDTTLTIVTPDLEYGAPSCATTFRMSSGFTPDGVLLGESAAVYVSSAGCGPVAWTPRVFVTDESLVHGSRTQGDVGSTANPTSAAATQVMEYGIGVREEGFIVFQFSATSRLGEICFQEQWHYDAITWQLKPLTIKAC